MESTSRDEHSSAAIGTEHRRDQSRARPPTTLGNELARDQVLDALRRILGSSDFIASARNRRFLEYVVGETLAGHSDRLKGYTIAVEVFGRVATFDANIDPVVRIEARRLREALERYYLTAGKADPIRISIPKGGYVPVFEQRVSAHPPGLPAAQLTSDPPQSKMPARRASWLLVALLATALALIVLLTIHTARHRNSAVQDGPLPDRPVALGYALAENLTGRSSSRASEGSILLEGGQSDMHVRF
jgi:hypothetical protein